MVEIIKTFLHAFSGSPSADANRVIDLDGRGGPPPPDRPDETFVTRSMQHYGFASVPPADTQVILIRQGNYSAAIAEEQVETLPDLDQGDVMLYVDGTHYIKIAADGVITIKTDKDVSVDAGSATVSLVAGSVKLGATSGLYKLLTDAFATAFNTHTHPVPGVTVGTGSTTSSAPTVSITPALNPTAFTSTTEAK